MLLHTQAINQLSAADYRVIEKEHRLLEQYLNNLGEACSCNTSQQPPDCHLCDHEKQTSCQGRLPSFLFSILDLAAQHFDHEERIMLSRPHVTEDYEYFRVHRQAHEHILQKLDEMVENCLSKSAQQNTAEIYRQFHHCLLDMFDEHDRNFDDPFIESTKNLPST